MKNILRENVIKNIIIILLLVFTYSEIQSFLLSPNFTTDKSIIGNFLVAVSILSVTACFIAFGITYEKIKPESPSNRLLAHLATGFPMLLIGLSLEMTLVLVRILIGDFYIFNLSLLCVYISTMLFDFWDLKRVEL